MSDFGPDLVLTHFVSTECVFALTTPYYFLLKARHDGQVKGSEVDRPLV